MAPAELSSPDLAPESLGVKALVEHVLASHHVVTRRVIQSLPALAKKVAAAHGAERPELHRLQETVAALFHELDAHMAREERVLFPYFIALADAEERGKRCRKPSFETAARPIRVMRMDHDAAAALLAEIAELTDGYRVPEGACGSWIALYEGLEAHTRDLQRHVWIENELLFPRAIELEARVSPR